jgi:hypothetical protein
MSTSFSLDCRAFVSLLYHEVDTISYASPTWRPVHMAASFSLVGKAFVYHAIS